MARLAATATSGLLPRYASAAREVVDAMIGHPDYVAGAWSITTPLMESFEGGLLAKEGAEGFYAIALMPELCEKLTERADRADGAAVGIAIKIVDGSMSRGRNPAILRTLELLGFEVDRMPLLSRYLDRRLLNVAGNQVGEIRPEFDLAFL
jgi:L-asparaginase II